jgi:outer membrane protein assembly factor BamB
MTRATRSLRSALWCAAAALLTAAWAAADDWPQWRGPNRDGKSAETGLLKRWPEDGPPLLWTATTAGEGFGAPSVAGGRVYVMGNGEKEQMHREWVVCLDEATGKQLWACKTGQIRSDGGGYPGPRSTPTVADGRVYALGLAGRILCCKAESGEPIWFRELTRDFGGTEPRYGYSESVLVDGQRVVCTPGGPKTVVALDAQTGRELWAAQVGDPASYSSIVKATLAGVEQYVAFTEKGVIGIRAADGALLWRYENPSNGQANCPTPLVVGSTVFAASGFGRGGGCAAIQKDDAGNLAAKELYFTNKMQNQYGGMVVVETHLYGCCDPGVLASIDYKTGIVSRAVRTGRFALAYADGMLYLRGEKGKMELFECGPKNLVSRGSFEQPQRSKHRAWPPPVIANGRLYLRDQYLVLCYDISAKDQKQDDKPNEKKPAAKDGEKKPAATAK